LLIIVGLPYSSNDNNTKKSRNKIYSQINYMYNNISNKNIDNIFNRLVFNSFGIIAGYLENFEDLCVNR
jgi:hypothetical protein